MRYLLIALVAGLALCPTAAAITPPQIDPGATPPNTVGPETPMEQREQCRPVLVREG